MSKVCPKCRDVLPVDARACACGWRLGGDKSKDSAIDYNCPWDDHGVACGKHGSVGDALNGSGPWYCPEHFWKLKGWPEKHGTGAALNYRQLWYAERGLPYQDPKPSGLAVKMPRRSREPGDDDEEISA